MGDAVERLRLKREQQIALAATVVESYRRRSKSGKTVTVSRHTRSVAHMPDADLAGELKGLFDKNGSQQRTRRTQIEREIAGRKRSGKWDPKVKVSRVSGSRAESLAQAAIEGGFTFDASVQDDVRSGIAVARPGTSSILPAKNRDQARKQLMDFFDSHPDAEVVGGWFDSENNEICLDIVDIIQDRQKAIELGRERNQQAVFDLAALEEIDTGGSGDERKY